MYGIRNVFALSKGSNIEHNFVESDLDAFKSRPGSNPDWIWPNVPAPPGTSSSRTLQKTPLISISE